MIAQGALLAGMLPRGDECDRRCEITGMLDRVVVGVTRLIAPRISLEIGAHKAWFSRQVKLRMPEARVVAFEAHPDVVVPSRERVTTGGVAPNAAQRLPSRNSPPGLMIRAGCIACPQAQCRPRLEADQFDPPD